MDERDFVNTILDDPDEEFPRLVFADWLEENGQGDRAEYVRAGCERSRFSPGEPGFLLASRRVGKHWDRCRPPLSDTVPPSGIGLSNERGLMRIVVQSRTAVAKLGKLPWLQRAIDGGWLSWISVTVNDESVVRALTTWKDPALQIPMHLWLDQPLSETVLALILAIPRLIKLDLMGPSLLTPSIHRLCERQDLRALSLRLGVNDLGVRVDREVVSALMENVGRLVHLRSLTLEGPRPSSEDPAFLSRLVHLTGLKTLTLIEWPDLTDASLDRLGELTGLRRLNLSRCYLATDEGIRRVRAALPSIRVERV